MRSYCRANLYQNSRSTFGQSPRKQWQQRQCLNSHRQAGNDEPNLCRCHADDSGMAPRGDAAVYDRDYDIRARNRLLSRAGGIHPSTSSIYVNSLCTDTVSMQPPANRFSRLPAARRFGYWAIHYIYLCHMMFLHLHKYLSTVAIDPDQPAEGISLARAKYIFGYTWKRGVYGDT